MKKSAMVVIAIIAVVLLIGVMIGGSYNKMVKYSQETDAQWSVVESKLQRRFDLIPNLVNSVKGVMVQEKEIFEHIADARAKLSGASNTAEQVNAANNLEGALGRLLVVMENYPDLKSSENVSKLMDELSGTENRISVERDRYNEKVKSYNSYITTLPRLLYARAFGFEEKAYFKAAEGSEKAPVVDFNN